MKLRVTAAFACKKLSLTMLLALVVLGLPAWAELGGNVASVKTDQDKLGGALKVTTISNYEVHEIQSPQGIKIREYVAPGGTIFGVTWQGQFTPDLRQLLGPYFDQYVNAAQAKKRTSRGPVTIELPNLVVQRGGHMRAYLGRAYLPQMVPQGVSIDAIQ